MSVATPAASRLLCRSLAANSAKTSSRAGPTTTTTTSSIPPCPRHPQQRRPFHTTPPALSRSRAHRSPYRNVTAKRMGLLNPDKAPTVMSKYKGLTSPDYDDTDIETLQRKYTPAQLEALAAGEAVVRPEDIVTQGRMRNDPYRPGYLDDFATMRPVVDRRDRSGKGVDTSARFMTPDDFADDFLEWIREQSEKRGAKQDMFTMSEALAMYEEMRSKMLAKEVGEGLTVQEASAAVESVLGPIQPIQEPIEAALTKKGQEEGKKDEELEDDEVDDTLEIYKYLTERNAMTGFDGGNSALAPALPPKLPGVAGLYKQDADEEDMRLDPEGSYQELRRQTGLPTRAIMTMFHKSTKVLVRRYVSNQTRLGKIRSTYVLAISGDRNGRLGLGEAKSVDSEIANEKAKLAAIKNMQPIRRYEQRTIYGNVEGKFGGTIVQLFSRPPGMCLVQKRFPESRP